MSKIREDACRSALLRREPTLDSTKPTKQPECAPETEAQSPVSNDNDFCMNLLKQGLKVVAVRIHWNFIWASIEADHGAMVATGIRRCRTVRFIDWNCDSKVTAPRERGLDQRATV